MHVNGNAKRKNKIFVNAMNWEWKMIQTNGEFCTMKTNDDDGYFWLKWNWIFNEITWTELEILKFVAHQSVSVLKGNLKCCMRPYQWIRTIICTAHDTFNVHLKLVENKKVNYWYHIKMMWLSVSDVEEHALFRWYNTYKLNAYIHI